MHTSFPPQRPLSIALALLFCSPLPVLAQQVIADGDDQTPAPGDYSTSEPVEPGNPAGYVFHALNGGTIVPVGEVNLRTAGMRAAAVRVEGVGSRVALSGGSITTTGYGAAGVSIASDGAVTLAGTRIETEGQGSFGIGLEGGALQASNVHIITRGGLGHGVSVRGGDVQLRDSVIETHDSASGLSISDGTVLAERVRLEQNTSGSAVTLQPGGAATATLRDVQINGTAGGASGISSGLGSQLLLENVNINLTHERSGVGLWTRGDVEFRGGRIHAAGENSTVITLGDDGSLLLEAIEMNGTWGISLRKDSLLEMHNSQLETEKSGIKFGSDAGEASIEKSSIHVRNGIGVSVTGNSKATMNASTVTTGGEQGFGVAVFEGSATLNGTTVHTTGKTAHALHTFGNNVTTPTIVASGIDVLTEGESAYGATARKGGSVHLVDSVLRTRGQKAHGVLADGRGELTLANTHVVTEGEGAWAAAIVDGGRLQIDGGSLVSEKHGGVWVRGSRDPGLTLSNGALVSGGNGIGLALDAAVAGRFDVLLDGRSQMVGDIVITPEDEDAGLVPLSEVHVRLADGSLWQGSSGLVQTMAIESGSQWTLTGDARVGGLQVLNSGVALSDGRGKFNTLTVDGDLYSEGATFLFQGALGGDDSAMDRLHVRGDTSGDALVAVKNIGGAGAPTVDGIQLIEVDGASLASYALSGRAVGGSYEYFLFQGGLIDPADGNWYLRSQWFDRCADDPAAPGCAVDPGPDPDPGEGGEGGPLDPGNPITPPPVLRPEAGAYLANQSAAINMFAHRLQERSGAMSRGDGRSAWARVGRSNADFSAVGGQLSVDGTTSVLQIGSDLLRHGNAAFGVMLGSGRTDSSAVSDLTGYSAKGRVRGSAVGMYGTWLQSAEGIQGAYIDANLQYGRFDNRVQGIGLEPEHYDSRMASASLETGYTFSVWQSTASALYVQPQLQLSYVDFRADRHVETNGTMIDQADAGGLSGRVGLRVFGHGTAAGNTMQPYLGVNWLRGSGTNTLQFNGDTLGADVPRNRYEVQAGTELKLGQRWGAWGGMSVQRGDHGFRNVGGQLGLRMAW